MRPFLPFATLLGVAFLLGCQDPGGPDTEIGAPNFFNQNKPKAHGGGESGPTLLFKDPSTTCLDGATDTGDGSFGKVSWAAVFSSDDPVPGHVHFKIQLRDVAEGTYQIDGTQRKTTGLDQGCHERTDIAQLTVGPKERGSTRNHFILEHSPGESKVWLTIFKIGGTAPLYQSPAVTIVMPEHAGHGG